MNNERHAVTAELVALRDGEGTAWTREHVAGCASCAGDLYRLDQMRSRLKALPTYSPPRDRWPLVASVARRERRRRWMQGAAGLAAAAVLSVLTFASLRPAATSDEAALDRAALGSAMARSEAMEQALRALTPDVRALPGSAAGAAADLENRLADVDAALEDPSAWRSDPRRVVELWEQRAGILSALVDVHVTRTAMAGL